jgi:predicted lipase
MNGKLDPVETLKLMEMVTQEIPECMDRGFTAYSECSNIGKYYTKLYFTRQYRNSC